MGTDPPAKWSDAVPLAWARLALGTLFLLRTTPVLAPLHLPYLDGMFPLLGWPTGAFRGPESLLALPENLIAVLCIVRTVAAAMFLLGIETRVAGLVAGAAGYLVMLRSPFGRVFTLHLLYQATMLLALTDAGSSLALRPRPPRAPQSGVLLIRIFVASIFLWAGLFKLRADWLDGRTLAMFHADGAIHGWLANWLLANDVRRTMVAWGVAITELSLPVLLCWRRSRSLGLAIAILFHVGVELTAHPDLLGWEMLALLLALLPASQGREHLAESAGQPIKPRLHISSSVRLPPKT